MFFLQTYPVPFTKELAGLTGAIAALAIYTIALALYRLTIHPLARFPGPKLSAATGWYECFLDIFRGPGETFAFEIERMHRRYGPIVRINPHELHIDDPDFISILYVGDSAKRNKYAPAAHILGMPDGMFGTVDHDLHRSRRAAVERALSKRRVATHSDVIHSKAQLLCSIFRDALAEGTAIDIRVPLVAYATDCFQSHMIRESDRLELLKDPQKAKHWKESVGALLHWVAMARQFPWVIKMAKTLPVWVLRRPFPELAYVVQIFKDMQAQAKSVTREWGSSTKEIAEHSSDLFQVILSSTLPPSEKGVKRMAEEAFTFLVASGETTGRILTTAMYHLHANPAYLESVRKELETVIPKAEDHLDIKALEGLPLLTAVIEESLRISGFVAVREPLQAPNEWLHYREWAIPPGTPMSMTSGRLMMDDRAYQSAMTFSPERWLRSNPELTRNRQHFFPFQRGHRMCIGRNLAYAEIYICLAALVSTFEFELFDVVRERDIDYARECFVGEPREDSKGVRLRVIREL